MKGTAEHYWVVFYDTKVVTFAMTRLEAKQAIEKHAHIRGVETTQEHVKVFIGTTWASSRELNVVLTDMGVNVALLRKVL